MADCVVDTNVALKWVLNEPDSTDAVRVANDIAATRGRLLLVDIARVEAVNVIWLQYHRGLLSEARARAALADLQQIPIVIVETEPLLGDAFDLALQFDIAVYDACFVAAVKQMGCLGVTADGPLIQKVGAAFPTIKLLKNW
jgi:predicted nucleic acid-binding protein